MGELRNRMENDLIVRGLSEHTQRAYLHAVHDLAAYYRQPPDQLDEQAVQRYLRYLIETRKLAWSSVSVAAHGLRFFFCITLRRPWGRPEVPGPKRGKKRPQILSREEVKLLLDATPNRKHRALLMTTYAAGLRVSEVVDLQISDLDNQRMLILVREGKGRKDRYTILSDRLLEELRGYWRVFRPAKWLFPGKLPDRPLTTRTASRVYNEAKARAGITKTGSIHSLRHAFATHLLEAGIDLHTIRQLLGHATLTTTSNYLHLAHGGLVRTRSALNLLDFPPTS